MSKHDDTFIRAALRFLDQHGTMKLTPELQAFHSAGKTYRAAKKEEAQAVKATSLRPGDRLRDNDGRYAYERILVIERVVPPSSTAHGYVKALDHAGKPSLIRLSRIFTDGKKRSKGFTLVPPVL